MRRSRFLNAVTPLTALDVRREVVRGQYAGYRGEPHVAPDSRTETYVALRLLLDNWRWAGVPFYLRTGKRLARRSTDVSVHFKAAPFMLFRETPVECTNPNVLVLRIQPDEGISLSFDAKVPGPLERLETVTMAQLRVAFPPGATGIRDLLFDAMTGDQTSFPHDIVNGVSDSSLDPGDICPRHCVNLPLRTGAGRRSRCFSNATAWQWRPSP